MDVLPDNVFAAGFLYWFFCHDDDTVIDVAWDEAKPDRLVIQLLGFKSRYELTVKRLNEDASAELGLGSRWLTS